MNTFSDLLATEFYLDIKVNGNSVRADIRGCLEFNAEDNVTIDGFEILPRYQYLAQDNVLKINEPFYCWYHRASGQGWLLKPY